MTILTAVPPGFESEVVHSHLPVEAYTSLSTTRLQLSRIKKKKRRKKETRAERTKGRFSLQNNSEESPNSFPRSGNRRIKMTRVPPLLYRDSMHPSFLQECLVSWSLRVCSLFHHAWSGSENQNEFCLESCGLIQISQGYFYQFFSTSKFFNQGRLPISPKCIWGSHFGS